MHLPKSCLLGFPSKRQLREGGDSSQYPPGQTGREGTAELLHPEGYLGEGQRQTETERDRGREGGREAEGQSRGMSRPGRAQNLPVLRRCAGKSVSRRSRGALGSAWASPRVCPAGRRRAPGGSSPAQPPCAAPLSVLRNDPGTFFSAEPRREAPKCAYIASVVVTLKCVELFCFDRTVTSQNLLLTESICGTPFPSLLYSSYLQRRAAPPPCG